MVRALTRLNKIQASAAELFWRMEHLQLDALFAGAGSADTVPQTKIDEALRMDAEWLSELLGLEPGKATLLIKGFNQRMIKKEKAD